MPAANHAPGVAGVPVVGFAGVTERINSTGRLSTVSPQLSGGVAPVASVSLARTTKSPSSSRSTGSELNGARISAADTAGGTGTLRQNSDRITWRGPAREPIPSAPSRTTPSPRPRMSPVVLMVASNDAIPHGAPAGATPATVFNVGAPAAERNTWLPVPPSNLNRIEEFP